MDRSAETIRPGIPSTELVFSIRPVFGLNLANQEKIIVKSNTPWQLELENYDKRLWGQNLKVSILYPSKTILKNIKITKPSLILDSNSKSTPNNGINIIINYPVVNPDVKFTLHSP